MNCPEVVENMQRYLDYDLSKEEVEEMFSHIASCSECAETFRMLKSLSRELEDLPEVTPKFSLVDAIMPQLDEIDRSRRERSVASQEQQDTVIPLSARKSRRQRLLGSTAARTLMGTAAAAVVLGVAIWRYEPQQLSNAEMQLLSTTTDSQEAERGSLSKIAEDTDESVAPDYEQERMLDQSTALSDSLAVPEGPQLPANDPNTAMESLPASEPGNANTPSSDAAMKSVPPVPSESAETSGTGNTGSTGSAGDAAKPSQDSATEPSSNSFNTAPDAAEQQLPDEAQGLRQADPLEDASVSNEAPKQSLLPSENDSDINKVNEPEATLFGIQHMALAPQQWLSGDQLHLAMLEGQELVIYSVTNGETNDMKEVQRVTLQGEWVSGDWSADSTVFNYQTNQNGKVIKEKVTVSKASNVKTP